MLRGIVLHHDMHTALLPCRRSIWAEACATDEKDAILVRQCLRTAQLFRCCIVCSFAMAAMTRQVPVA
jgi:hypothetical protein